MTSLLLPPLYQATDANGKVAASAKLFVYDEGTTTLADTYSDKTLTTPSTVDGDGAIVADANGHFVNIYVPTGQNYKLVLKTSADVTIMTRDSVIPYIGNGGATLPVASGGTGGTTAAAARTNLSVPLLSDFTTVQTSNTTLSTGNDQATWNTGTDTTEVGISAAKLAAKILNANDLRPHGADAVVAEQKSSGTDGGTATSTNGWETRAINTEIYDDGGYVSISSNRMTFTADGFVEFTVPGFACAGFSARFYNATDGAVATGNVCQAGYCNTGVSLTGQVTGYAKVEASKAYELQFQVETTRATDGWGSASNVGSEETYAIVKYFRERKNS